MDFKYVLSLIVFQIILLSNVCIISDSQSLEDDMQSIIGIFESEENFPSLSNFMSLPIDNVCLSYYKQLTLTSSQFIECAVNNSRPFHLCSNCLKSYLQLKDVRNLIYNVNN